MYIHQYYYIDAFTESIGEAQQKKKERKKAAEYIHVSPLRLFFIGEGGGSPFKLVVLHVMFQKWV
jgi:hypothetical protein